MFEIGDRVRVRLSEWLEPAYNLNLKGYHGTIIGMTDYEYIVELDKDVMSELVARNGRMGHCVLLRGYVLRKIKTKIPNSKRRVKIVKHVGDGLLIGIMSNKKKVILKNKSNEELPIDSSIVVRGGMMRDVFVVHKIE